MYLPGDGGVARDSGKDRLGACATHRENRELLVGVPDLIYEKDMNMLLKARILVFIKAT